MTDQEEPLFMMTDLAEPDSQPAAQKGKLRTWWSEHSDIVWFIMFLAIMALIGFSPIIAKELYTLPVYELEVDGYYRCIGTHETIDLLKMNPYASIVKCEDGSYFPNATNVRYIRLISPGHYF